LESLPEPSYVSLPEPSCLSCRPAATAPSCVSLPPVVPSLPEVVRGGRRASSGGRRAVLPATVEPAQQLHVRAGVHHRVGDEFADDHHGVGDEQVGDELGAGQGEFGPFGERGADEPAGGARRERVAR
jgi:hypothetical protein